MKQGNVAVSRFSRSLLAVGITASLMAPGAWAAPGDPIGDLILLSTDPEAILRDIASDSAGEFVVTWTEYAGRQTSIYGQIFGADGTPAGPAFLVSTSQPNGSLEVSHPRVAMDPAGDFVIVWERISGVRRYPALSDASIHAQRYAAGGVAKGAPILIAGNGTAPDVAMDDDGDFTVAWAVDGTITAPWTPLYGLPVFVPSANRPDAIRVRRFRADGLPSSLPLTVASANRGIHPLDLNGSRPIVHDVTIASDGAGNSTVGWTRSPVDATAPSTLEAQRVSSDGRALSSSFMIDSVYGYTGRLQFAMNAAGELAAVYTNSAGTHVKSYASNGQALIQDLQPSTAPLFTPESFTSTPVVAIDSLGAISVAAASGSGDTNRINLRLFDRGGLPLSTIIAVTDPSTFMPYSTAPALAVDGAGNPVIAYRGYRLVTPIRTETDARRYSGH